MGLLSVCNPGIKYKIYVQTHNIYTHINTHTQLLKQYYYKPGNSYTMQQFKKHSIVEENLGKFLFVGFLYLCHETLLKINLDGKIWQTTSDSPQFNFLS